MQEFKDVCFKKTGEILFGDKKIDSDGDFFRRNITLSSFYYETKDYYFVSPFCLTRQEYKEIEADEGVKSFSALLSGECSKSFPFIIQKKTLEVERIRFGANDAIRELNGYIYIFNSYSKLTVSKFGNLVTMFTKRVYKDNSNKPIRETKQCYCAVYFQGKEKKDCNTSVMNIPYSSPESFDNSRMNFKKRIEVSNIILDKFVYFSIFYIFYYDYGNYIFKRIGIFMDLNIPCNSEEDEIPIELKDGTLINSLEADNFKYCHFGKLEDNSLHTLFFFSSFLEGITFYEYDKVLKDVKKREDLNSFYKRCRHLSIVLSRREMPPLFVEEISKKKEKVSNIRILYLVQGN